MEPYDIFDPGEDEMIVFIIALVYVLVFIFQWYGKTSVKNNYKDNSASKILLKLLPVLSSAVILVILRTLADPSVKYSFFYTLMYLLIGLSWLHVGVLLMFIFFDLSWRDDALGMANSAAAFAILGGGLGIAATYSGANTGDGPGWWCVFFAGFFGLAAWIILGTAAGSIAGVFRQITAGRDASCGVRTGAYLLSSGIIFGYACGGDWTSAGDTVVEFFSGCWPALVLTAVFILLELAFAASRKAGNRGESYSQDKALSLSLSVLLSLIYIAATVFTVFFIMPPLPVNPFYH